MPNPLKNSRVALGVTGSIACYKAIDLASKLTQSGALVDVIMTKAATNFLSPITFQSITHRPVTTEIFNPQSEMGMDHITIAKHIDVIVVAPITAHTMAKIACGLADDALSTTILATRSPVILAPSMDAHMYDNPITQENANKLASIGHTIVGPEEGRLASGIWGNGRMVSTQEILDHISIVLGRKGDLVNRKITISAGGTREPLDPVRVISNRSSGKMGYAIAKAARDRGATTVIVSAQSALPNPIGIKVIQAETALKMKKAVHHECENADALIMAAAVSDWRPTKVASHKIKKDMSDTWTIELTKNPDILEGTNQHKLIKIGFAAESELLQANAHAKLVSKGLHLIVANEITSHDSGFGTDTNKVTLIDNEGGVEELPLMTKYEVGHRILDRVVALLK